MPLIDGREGSAIYCHNSRGPVFGGGHDLCVPDSPNSSNCSVTLGITYQCPAGQNGNLFLTGSQYFVVNEMEVFVFKNQRHRCQFSLPDETTADIVNIS